MMRQLVLPMIAGMEVTKTGLLAFVHAMGRAVLDELLASDAEASRDRTCARSSLMCAPSGTTSTPLPFGGATSLSASARAWQEERAALPLIEELRRRDPLPDRVAQQIVLGVSTRGYAQSLEPVAGERTHEPARVRRVVR